MWKLSVSLRFSPSHCGTAPLLLIHMYVCKYIRTYVRLPVLMHVYLFCLLNFVTHTSFFCIDFSNFKPSMRLGVHISIFVFVVHFLRTLRWGVCFGVYFIYSNSFHVGPSLNNSHLRITSVNAEPKMSKVKVQ